MSANSHRIREVLVESLSDLEDSLGSTEDDTRLLHEVQERIGGLLRDDIGAEREIRAVLQERYNDGDLRTETYDLVRTMLERKVTEELQTEPTGRVTGTGPLLGETDLVTTQYSPLNDLDKSPDPDFAATAVIEKKAATPTTADDQVQVGSLLRDRYLLQERVSGGSMGVVYKALDRRMAEAGAAEPWVAIKILSPQLSRNATALRALQQEATKGRSLAHANIVRFIDLDREDDLYFIVMEWMDGRTLADILDASEGTPMPVDEAFGIVRQLASALGYAHRCGIIHADVKPANVMVLPSGDVKLFDFGVARVKQSQKDARSEFDPGVLGALTPAYSSMQVLTGEEPVPADDVFSLGCLLYRLVAGHRVFGPRNAAEAAAEGMTPKRPQGLSEDQWRALKKAMSFSRVTRYQDMDEFMAALEKPVAAAYADIDIGPADSLFDEDEPGGSRSWLFGLVALVLLLGFVVYQFGFSDRFEWGEKISAWAESQMAAFTASDAPATPTAAAPDDIVDLPPDEAPPVAEFPADDSAPAGTAAAAAPATGEPSPDAAADSTAPAEPTVADAAPPDLPPADVEVILSEGAIEPQSATVVLREDGPPAVVELRRTGNLDSALRLRIEEVGFTGNRSPWATAQFSLTNDGDIEIPAGEDRTRVTLEMAGDARREADQGSTLRVRSADAATTLYATLQVQLEDDDQRAFESRLPTNTIGFAVNQIAVRERDPVVQIDVSRFNPDDTQVVVSYRVEDITAKEGEDYFAPGGYSVSFGPGQRSARLLIPLVQDTIAEGDEAFAVELDTQDTDAVPDVFKRVVVMIRDDEIASR